MYFGADVNYISVKVSAKTFSFLISSLELLASRIAFTMRSSVIVATLLSAILVGAVDPVVDLSYARYEGTALPGGVTQWLGVRYAVRSLRFHVHESCRLMAPSPGTATWAITLCSPPTPSVQFNCSEGQ
jgi:hypothetical protein